MTRDYSLINLNNDQLDKEQIEQLEWLHAKSKNFNHDDQIGLCAKLIEVARDELIKRGQWEGTKNPKKGETDSSTRKNLLMRLIRVSSEPSNFTNNVDFVTPNALTEKVRKKSMSKDQKKIKEDTRLSHEHMVPCQAIFEKIIQLPPTQDVSTVMKEFGFRALIYRGDKSHLDAGHTKLDKEFKDRLPEFLPSNFEMKYYPFARYEAAGIYSSLIGVSERGITLLESYNKIRKDYLDENGQWKYMK